MSILKVFLLVLTLSSGPTFPQEFPDIRPRCTEETKDKWGIRRPTTVEAQEYGSHVLLFEYWNSLEKCSSDYSGEVQFESYTFGLEVNVGVSQEDEREQIILTVPLDVPYVTDKGKSYGELLLDDGEEPGLIILHPMLM